MPLTFFDDPDMDFAARCVLSGVRHGMSEVGETLTALGRVTDGDPDSWLHAFVALGRRLRSVADEAARRGHRYSAWNAALRSANYLYAGLWWAPATSLASQQADALWLEHRASWDLAIAHWPSPVERFDLAVSGTALPGLWFSSPTTSGRPAPAVVLVQGLGTPISDICMTGLDGALARGHHVAVVDGPGQGDALHRLGRTLDDTWTDVIDATITWVAARHEVDVGAISLLGVGAGALFAARAAAAHVDPDRPRPAALVLDPAVVDLGDDAAAAVQGAIDDRSRQLLGATVTAPTGAPDLAAGVDALRRHRLTESEASRISCPTLIVTADEAFGFRGQDRTLRSWLRAPADQVVLHAADGAGADNGIDASQIHDAAAFDWLDATLSPDGRRRSGDTNPPEDSMTEQPDTGPIGAIGWMRSLVIDAQDPARLAAFWCAVLGVEVAEEESDWVQLTPDPGGTFLAFQPSDAARPSRLVARPDIEVTDIDEARERVHALGGAFQRTIDELKGDHHYVMADPEGNEFCLVQPLPPELARPRWGDRAV